MPSQPKTQNKNVYKTFPRKEYVLKEKHHNQITTTKIHNTEQRIQNKTHKKHINPPKQSIIHKKYIQKAITWQKEQGQKESKKQ